jgi:hypothetical protein
MVEYKTTRKENMEPSEENTSTESPENEDQKSDEELPPKGPKSALRGLVAACAIFACIMVAKSAILPTTGLADTIDTINSEEANVTEMADVAAFLSDKSSKWTAQAENIRSFEAITAPADWQVLGNKDRLILSAESSEGCVIGEIQGHKPGAPIRIAIDATGKACTPGYVAGLAGS